MTGSSCCTSSAVAVTTPTLPAQWLLGSRDEVLDDVDPDAVLPRLFDEVAGPLVECHAIRRLEVEQR